MAILNALISFSILGSFFFAYLKWRQNLRSGEKMNFTMYRPLFFSVILTILIIGLCNFFQGPSFNNYGSELTFAKLYGRDDLKADAYEALTMEHPENPEFAYQWIKLTYDNRPAPEDRRTRRNEKTEGERIFLENYYKIYHLLIQQASSDDRKINQGGLISLAIYHYFDDEIDSAKYKLTLVYDSSIAGYKFIKGKMAADAGNWHEASIAMQEELEQHPGFEPACRWLGFYYNEIGDFDALINLSKKSFNKLPLTVQKAITIHQKSFGQYFKLIINRFFSSPNIINWIGSLMVAGIWVIYLLKIDVFEKEKIRLVITTFLLGSLFVLPALTVYDIYEFRFHYELNGNILNDLLYSILGIGLIEEFFKIIPFLFILFFTKAINEPVDYLIYAMVGALGFAFMENVIYFTNPVPGTVILRAMISTLGHMFDSCLIAYGLVIAKYRFKHIQILYFILFFACSITIHGLYDFWLINPSVKSFSGFSILLWIFSVHSISIFINNTLNNSPSFTLQKSINSTTLLNYIISSLLIILAFEFFTTSWIHGGAYSSESFASSMTTYSIFLIGVAVVLSNMDLVPNEWQSLHSFTPKTNHNKALDLDIEITALRQESILNNLLPVKGKIEKRVNLSDANDCFLVKLNNPIILDEHEHNHIFIKSKDGDFSLEKNKNMVVYFLQAIHPDYYNDIENIDENFQFIDWAVVN